MQYFKEKIGSTAVLFLQETHSDFKGPVFFSGKVKFLWR